MKGEIMKSIKKYNKIITFIVILLIVIVFIVVEAPSLKDKLERVVQNVRFKTITKNMSVKKVDNITYYYLNKGDETFIDNIEKYIKEAEVNIVPLLGHTTVYPYNIIMFATPEAFGKACYVNPKKSGAVTGGTSLYIPCANIKLDLLAHEYTHYKINSLCKEKSIQEFKIPSWFHEGVAEYVSLTLSPDRFRNIMIKNVQDFKDLDGNTQFIGADNNKAYMQSYIAVKKIIKLKGQNAIKEILINSKSMTFDNSFEKVVGLSINDFQKLLENQLESTDSVDILLRLGLTYTQQKKFDKAKDTFLEAIKKYPLNVTAWLRLGNCYVDLGDLDSARKAREQLISIEGEKEYSCLTYSRSLISTDLDKAILMAEKAAQFSKTDVSDSYGYIFGYLSLLKDIKGNSELDEPFAQYVTLIESGYLNENNIKIDIINKVLLKYPDKNDNQKEQLIKIKSDLENQK
jgi:tetratricopeptide (TPR) repeat protein